jgi:hypothetical protein
MTAIDVNSTLKPGRLISLKTSVDGNVTYDKETIEAEHKMRSGAVKSSWQTERTIADPAEHKAAQQARMKARGIVVSICAKSAFGLLCPESNIKKLELAIAEARRVVDAFNKKSKITTVSLYVISGRIARDDVEAARAIKAEVREMLTLMQQGLKDRDVEKVRRAANQGRNIGAMLEPAVALVLKGAVDAARKGARKIVKEGEDAAAAIDREALNALQQARTAFLDVDDEPVIRTEGEEAHDDAEEAGETVEAPAAARLPRVARRRSTASTPAAKGKKAGKVARNQPSKPGKVARRRPAEARA